MKVALKFDEKVSEKVWTTLSRLTARQGSPRNLRRARRRAVQRAYKQFARRYPRWAQSLFDEYFVNNTAQDVFTSGLLRPRDLAEAWTRQLRYRDEVQRRQHVCQIMPVAQIFVRLVRAEMVV